MNIHSIALTMVTSPEDELQFCSGLQSCRLQIENYRRRTNDKQDSCGRDFVTCYSVGRI